MSTITVLSPVYTQRTAPRGAQWAAQAAVSLIHLASAAWTGFLTARRLERARRTQGANAVTLMAMTQRLQGVEPGPAQDLVVANLRQQASAS